MLSSAAGLAQMPVLRPCTSTAAPQGSGCHTLTDATCLCQAPIYDFKSSTRTGFRQVDVPKSRVVIIEGIYALSTRIRCCCWPLCWVLLQHGVATGG